MIERTGATSVIHVEREREKEGGKCEALTQESTHVLYYLSAQVISSERGEKNLLPRNIDNWMHEDVKCEKH